MSRKSFTPTTNYIKIGDIASNPIYKMNLSDAQELISERDKNGLIDCGIQIGRRFFIDEQKFQVWLENKLK